jgi:cell division protease FtsH
MVTRYGMDESLGYVTFGRQEPRLLAGNAGLPTAIDASEATLQRVDEAVRHIVMHALELAAATLVANGACSNAARVPFSNARRSKRRRWTN